MGLSRWWVTLATIPVALFLWVAAFITAGAGHGSYALFCLFYAPAFLVWPEAGFFAGPLLHLAYALCADGVRTARVRRRWVLGLAALHYLSLLAISAGVGAMEPYGRILDEYFTRSLRHVPWWILSGIVVFLGWQVILARSIMRPAKR